MHKQLVIESTTVDIFIHVNDQSVEVVAMVNHKMVDSINVRMHEVGAIKAFISDVVEKATAKEDARKNYVLDRMEFSKHLESEGFKGLYGSKIKAES